MNFNEYMEVIKNIPYSDNLKYKPAIMWLHREHLPLCVSSLGDNANGVIKIPNAAENPYGNLVPVIDIIKETFAYQDKISDIVLPSSIERIPKGAFTGCSELRRITIPKNIKTISEGTFEGCCNLEDVYYEGSMEEWKQINIVCRKHIIEFGPLISGTPVNEIKSERLQHISGNDALLNANVHFHCVFPNDVKHSSFCLTARGKDITDLFRI